MQVSVYCREVEAYLCRRNGGHLVRIVGPSFEMVRRWAESGVPISLVQRAIDVCTERRESRREASRPLRIEFCEAEVRDQFQRWRRAVGPYLDASAGEDEPSADEGGSAGPPPLAGHITRALERLSRAAARLDRSEAFRTALDGIIGQVSEIQAASKGVRGERRDAFLEQLRALDAMLMAAARDEAARATLVTELRDAAARELAPWRERMPGDAWTAAISAASDRLLRDRLDLPDLAV